MACAGPISDSVAAVTAIVMAIATSSSTIENPCARAHLTTVASA
jgi:hypothetical protein